MTKGFEIRLEDYMLFDIGRYHYVAVSSSEDYHISGSTTTGLATVVPLTALKSGEGNSLHAYIQQALEIDDVLDASFVSNVFITVVEDDHHAELDLSDFHHPKVDKIQFLTSRNDSLPGPGPFLLRQGYLRQVLRLYDDFADAFVLACQPQSSDAERWAQKLAPLRVYGEARASRSIAVPSRLRSNASNERPLDGWRCAVKDMFDIEGLRTSLGSRAYLESSIAAYSTSPAIEQLRRKGAQIVGLTQMCSMAGKTDPTQCIDYPAPWNPRGDGYQSPSGGSSGQAAAVASYEWLDIAIGSDSTISGRTPAQANGCFSMRPSVGAVSTVGMWSGVPTFDTPCFFGRDFTKFLGFARAWYGHCSEVRPLSKTELPWAILYPSICQADIGDLQARLFHDFVEGMATCLQVRATELSIVKAWEQDAPEEAHGASIEEFLNEQTATSSYVYSIWKQMEPFIKSFTAHFRRRPYFPPPEGTHVWNDAKAVTPTQHAEAMSRINVYKQWLLRSIFRQTEQNSVFVMPLGPVVPCYRDEWPSETGRRNQQLWEPLLLAPILGAPEIVVPADEVKFSSRISGRTEMLPVCFSVMGLPGTDLQLIEIIQKYLESSNRPLAVQTGRTMFS